jgi:hypothetical protein
MVNDNYYNNLLFDRDLMNKDLDSLLEDKDQVAAAVVVVVESFEEGEEVLHLGFV